MSKRRHLCQPRPTGFGDELVPRFFLSPLKLLAASILRTIRLVNAHSFVWLVNLWYTAWSRELEEEKVSNTKLVVDSVLDVDVLAAQPETQAKLAHMHAILDELGSAVVAYSGGVDSAFLLYAAHARLGDRAVGLTVVSPSLSQSELEEAKSIARQVGARHILMEGHEAEDPNYLANTPLRCYFCKTETFDLAVEFAAREGLAAVLDGTNADDMGDHRPGRQAAREHGVRSPLFEVGLTKAEIRALSKQVGLPSWNKPALACLSSRVPYGTRISVRVLSQIERAEAAVRALGVRQLRVRHHPVGKDGSGGELARIEVEPEDFGRLLAHRDELVAALKALGYTYVTLDLTGFRSGSMNEGLPDYQKAESGR